MTENRSAEPNWRTDRYRRFYEVVDQVVDEIQHHAWEATGQSMRKLAGHQEARLKYSVESLIGDSVAVVLQRKQKGEARIKLAKDQYSANRDDSWLTYSIHVQRAYRGMLELGYLEETRRGYYDRTEGSGQNSSRVTRYMATDRLLELFDEQEQKALPVIVPSRVPTPLIRVQRSRRLANGRRLKERLPIAPEVEGEARLLAWNLERINRNLLRHWPDLELPDEDMAALQARLADDKENERQLPLNH